MSVPSREQVEKIHAAYKALTGIDIPMSMQHWMMWEAWLIDFTEPDLACVVRYLKKRIATKRRENESLLLRNLIVSRDKFHEELAAARMDAHETWIKRDGKRSVLRATGRPTEQTKTAQTAAEIMEQQALMAQMLRQWKAENPL